MYVVLDASIAIKWFSSINEEHVENALAIQEKQVSGEINIIVPDLFFLEVLNAFITSSQFSAEDILIIKDVLFKMSLEIKYPDDTMLTDSSKIAFEQDLTIYDSIYIAVAKSCDAILYTEDKKILSCNKNYPFITDIKNLIWAYL